MSNKKTPYEHIVHSSRKLIEIHGDLETHELSDMIGVSANEISMNLSTAARDKKVYRYFVPIYGDIRKKYANRGYLVMYTLDEEKHMDGSVPTISAEIEKSAYEMDGPFTPEDIMRETKRKKSTVIYAMRRCENIVRRRDGKYYWVDYGPTNEETKKENEKKEKNKPDRTPRPIPPREINTNENKSLKEELVELVYARILQCPQCSKALRVLKGVEGILGN